MKKIICLVLAIMLLLCACRNETLPENENPVSGQESISQPEENSEPEENYGGEPSQTDYAALRALCEYPNEQQYNDIIFNEDAAYAFSAIGPVQLEIPRVIYWGGAFGEFEFAEDIPDEKLIEAALEVLPAVHIEDGSGYYAEGVEELYAAAGNSEFWPKEWVEIFAEKLLGEKVEIEHKSVPELGIDYYEKAGVYTPLGTERGFRYPYIVDIEYRATGGCSVKYFYITEGMPGFVLGDGDEWLVPGEEPLWEDERVLEFAESGKDIYTANLIDAENQRYYLFQVTKLPQEPELIAEHIAALNEVERETWFIESDDSKNYVPLYKDNSDEPFWDKTPDEMALAKDVFNGRAENGMYDGYYYHGMVETCETITNFSTEQEIADHLAKWIDPAVFDNENFRKHIMEYDGKLYFLRYSKGYGVSYYGDTVITEQTEKEMTAVTKMYRITKNEVGTAEIKFENRGGSWIIVSVEENYY